MTPQERQLIDALFDRLAVRPLIGEDVMRRVRLVFRRDTPRRPALDALAATIVARLPESVRRIG